MYCGYDFLCYYFSRKDWNFSVWQRFLGAGMFANDLFRRPQHKHKHTHTLSLSLSLSLKGVGVDGKWSDYGVSYRQRWTSLWVSTHTR